MATHQKKHIKHFRGSSELILCANDNEFYAQVNKNVGDARFEIRILINNYTIIAKARGALIKGPGKKRILKDDYVLVQQADDKYYIMHKYSNEDVKKLSKLGELKTWNSHKDENVSFDISFEDEEKLEEISEEVDDEFIAKI
jgi:translation initiation factor IF-1